MGALSVWQQEVQEGIQRNNIFHIATADRCEKRARQSLRANSVIRNAEICSILLPIAEAFESKQWSYFPYRAILNYNFSLLEKS